jgi:DNA-directed RNA polymerase subunit K
MPFQRSLGKGLFLMKEYDKYERARIIGARSLQLARGAKPALETNLKSPIEIAQLEFEKGVCPIDTVEISRLKPIKE